MGASFSTQFEQSCKMRNEKTACKKEKSYSALARKYEKGHVQYRKRMVDLKCYQYEKQWAKKAAKKGKAKGKKAAKKGKKKKAAKKKKLEEEEEEFQEEGSYDDEY